MVKRSKKSKSKRVTLRQKHKVLRKVKEHDMEKMVTKADPSKRIVLLHNKIDLVPKEAVEKWLTYLREEMPTIAFKCNTQEQRTKPGWKSSKLDKTNSIPQSSDCLGAENLIRLLKKYSRSHELKLAITVGIVGLPNVGKSSLINSLKRSRVVNVGSTPGVTRSMQEVQLDKKVKLLDCPGVVMLKSSNSGVSVALRNCKRVEKMEDPVTPGKLVCMFVSFLLALLFILVHLLRRADLVQW
jgi:nuclear GTP-binding protein